jgi:outer membrane protein assembly factor BamE
MRRSRTLLFVVACSLLAACSSYKPSFINEYRIDVQQGNVLTQEMVGQLKPGQTRDQVRFILGSPLITDIFHRQRWDYVYRFRDGRTGAVEARQFSVFFDAEDRLARVAGLAEVGAVDELNTTVSRSRLVDLGTLSAEAAAQPLVIEEPGFFRRMMNKVGL